MNKKCYTCKHIKPLSGFNRNKSRKDGLNSICKECSRESSKRYYNLNRESHLQVVYAYRKKHYIKYRALGLNVNVKDAETLFENSDGRCEICKKVKKLSIDHDHDTNKVRGLLCTTCNLAIGHLKDSIENLESAIEYLQKSNGE